MSEKVKLTREQAEAIEKYRVNQENHLANQLAEADDLVEWAKPLAELGIHEIMEALYNDYEVEPEFEVGDWVKDTSTNAVIKINDRQHRNNLIDPRHTTIRHATPEEIAEEKQRRWWKSHNRGVWEIKKDDSLIHNTESEYPDIIFEVGDFNIHFTDGHFYPKEYIKENYKVFCFAEDRKDVDHA